MKAITLLGDAAHCAQAGEYLRDLLTGSGVRVAMLHETGKQKPVLEADYIEISAAATTMQLAKRVALEDIWRLSDAHFFIAMNMECPHMASLFVGDAEDMVLPSNTVARLIWPGRAQMQDGTTYVLPAQEKQFVQALLERSFKPLPGLNCGKCAWKNCRQMADAIVRQEASTSDCVAEDHGVTITLDGKPLPLVGYVARTVRNVILGMVKEMKGYRNPREVCVAFRVASETDDEARG